MKLGDACMLILETRNYTSYLSKDNYGRVWEDGPRMPLMHYIPTYTPTRNTPSTG